MKIHIMGASCAGSTTLGNALAQHLGYTYLDTDKYFWQSSEIPFTVKREREERIAMLKSDFSANDNVIVGGSLVSWGDDWLSLFDLVVFLYIPNKVRMQRLHQREVERYGDKIFTDPFRVEQYKRFKDWANGYDDNTTNGRNLKVHQLWMNQTNCPILKIEGDTSVDERIDLIINKLRGL